jgi:hypothetical protein
MPVELVIVLPAGGAGDGGGMGAGPLSVIAGGRLLESITRSKSSWMSPFSAGVCMLLNRRTT